MNRVATTAHLLAQHLQGAVLDEVRSLHGAGSGEGPAAAARSLVLDRGHGALGDPVHLH